jgi:neurotransmitter:Na+ symporter, NSS family
MKNRDEFFTSRWGMILAVVGIAVGTGNIWRFPRIVAQNDGGSFLIPWVVFLFIWSIPLIIAEIGIGKKTRKGTVGAIAMMAGKKFGWMGAFIGFVSTAIMFYYAVVAGWCLRYLYVSMSGSLVSMTDHVGLWESFTGSYQPLVFHFLAMLLGVYIIYRGVVKGIERWNRVLVPALLIMLVMLAVRAVTLDGALEGIVYLFKPNTERLLDYRIWLQALTQNAWDTGAGWGLIMTYAVYSRKREDIALNAALTGLSNNSVSLLAAIIVFATIFGIAGVSGVQELEIGTGSTNIGMAFIFLPRLFTQMPGGPVVQSFFSTIFFLSLSIAAISSLISMIELAVRVFIDMGLQRKNAILLVGSLGFLFGIPSALSLGFFYNQDWVWGVALMISGGFISFSVIKYGTDTFRREVINGEGSDVYIGRWYNFIITILIPLEVVILIVWWLYSATQWDSSGWWNPLGAETLGTCILQWGVIILVFIALNKLLIRKTFGTNNPREADRG